VFVAINSEEVLKKQQEVAQEKSIILRLYKNCCKSFKCDILHYKIRNKENTELYKHCKYYFLIKFIILHSYDELVSSIDLKLIVSDEKLFLYLLEKVIDDSDLVRARKMLMFAKKHKYFNRKYYDLKERYKRVCRRARKFALYE
ncbi:hypothetical protein VCUG_01404, partial [Vavraia culicis subsp. floridensis]